MWLWYVDTPEAGHGWEVEAEAELEDNEGSEGQVSHEGTVSGAVSRECKVEVRAEQGQAGPQQNVSCSSASDPGLEYQGAQHDRHHEGGEDFPQWQLCFVEALRTAMITHFNIS